MRKVLAAMLLGAAVTSANAVITFDDFMSGPYGVTLTTGSDLAEQSGSMVGGFRQTKFEATALLNRLSSMEVLDGLFVEAGVKSSSVTTLYYGFRKNNGGLDDAFLNADVSGLGLDALAIDFISNDLDLNYEITVVSDNGASSAVAVGTVGSGVDFTQLVPLASFVGTVNLADVDQIVWKFSSAPSGDFAISSFGAVVPEPASLAAIGIGLAAMARRRRRA